MTCEKNKHFIAGTGLGLLASYFVYLTLKMTSLVGTKLGNHIITGLGGAGIILFIISILINSAKETPQSKASKT